MADLVGKISARSYYDYFPPSSHAPGDIWMHLPTHGLLRRGHASALVVTPSCDLFNRKVSTITYLPIISFLDWVSSRDFLAEIVGTMLSLVDQLGPLGVSNASALDCSETFNSELSEQLTDLGRRLAKGNSNKSLRTAAERYIAGGKHLKRVSQGVRADVRDLETCLTKKRWEQVRIQLVRNALRSDLYFLPSDGNIDLEISPIASHSVALFRYPLTVPVSLLDAAQDTSLTDWSEATTALALEEPMASTCSKLRPLKCLRLQSRFLVDLLTKFVALYSRIGSPDFTHETVETLTSDKSVSYAMRSDIGRKFTGPFRRQNCHLFCSTNEARGWIQRGPLSCWGDPTPLGARSLTRFSQSAWSKESCHPAL